MDTSFFTEFMPHGHCYAWHPTILWMSVLSDIAIALSYFTIPIALLVFIRKRSGLRFKGIFILFALFILLCGITHLISVYTIWFGTYGLHALAKLATALVSVVTAVLVFKKIDQALAIPSVSELKAAIDEAAAERIKRSDIENTRRSDAIFKFTTELVPTGLLVVDQYQHVRLANQAAVEMFGYTHDEIQGIALSELIEASDKDRHKILVDDFLAHSREVQAMASGRIVKGLSKSGESISVELKIAVHELDGECFAFANIINVDKLSAEKQQVYQYQDRVIRAIEATNEGVWEWNVQSNEVWYSPKLMSLIGHSDKKEGRFEHWEAHIHQDDRQYVFDKIQEHFSSKAPFDLIYRGLVDGGLSEWMHTRGDTIFDKDGKPLLMTGTLSNINEIQMLREDLNEKTRFLDQVLEKSLTGVYVFNFKSQRNVFINAEYTHLSGWTLEELDVIQDDRGGLVSLFHPDDQSTIIDHFSEVIESKGNRGLGVEYRFKHKNGHWMWCYSRDSILTFDKDGKPEEMLGTFFDITDMKVREEEMRQLAMNFTATFDQAAVGMALVELNGKFSKVNTKLCEVLGYTEDDLLALSFENVTYIDDLEQSQKSFKSLLDGQAGQFIVRKRYQKKDGTVIWAQVTAAMVLDENGNNSHLVSVVEDISERVNVENALAVSNASLERFAYSASHDLQEPLRKISAFSGMLIERLNGKLTDKDAIFQLNRISDSAKRMGEMIQSLLELSRFSREELSKSPESLAALLAQVMDDLGPRIESSKTTIDLQEDATLYVERNSFQQVLQNLINNSIQYSKPNAPSAIVISTKRNKGTIEIHFSDNGAGFAKDFEEQIFEPFRRLVTRDKPGTGMGLAICRQIIRSHKGEIYAKALVDGAEFVIVLPIVE